MFDIGVSELLLVGLVALLVVRPDRLPGLARTAGTWMRRARTMMESVKADVDREFSRGSGAATDEYENLKREFSELRAEMSRFSRDARGALIGPAQEPPQAEPHQPGDALPPPTAGGPEDIEAPPASPVPADGGDGPGLPPPPPL
ncbi:MAG TPA: Sec-independent protein translocase protein TatB [Gammaproteobacteria bacterium]|nr:Sec-independent protein translocase protein TatB [Gammaproteobacteria bacterium]